MTRSVAASIGARASRRRRHCTSCRRISASRSRLSPMPALVELQGPTSLERDRRNASGRPRQRIDDPLRRSVSACSGIRRSGRCVSIWPIRSRNTVRRRRAAATKFVTARRSSVSAAAPSSDLGCRWRYHGSDCSRMSEPIFLRQSPGLTLEEIAALTGATLAPPAPHSRRIVNIAPLDRAAPSRSHLSSTAGISARRRPRHMRARASRRRRSPRNCRRGSRC